MLLLALSATTYADALACPSKPTLVFGMVPVVSSNLTEVWASRINQRLQHSACFSFSFRSASDFRHYIHKAKQGEFDLLAAPSHIASHLIASANFKPVAFLAWDSRYLFVTPAESTLTSIGQLNNHALALADPLSAASILAMNDIAAIDVRVNTLYFRTFNEVLEALLNGEADLGVLLSPFYNAYKQRTNIQTRVLHSAPFPSHGLLLAAPHIDSQQVDTLFNTLSSLEPNTGLFWQSFLSAPLEAIEQLHQDQRMLVKPLEALLDNNNESVIHGIQ